MIVPTRTTLLAALALPLLFASAGPVPTAPQEEGQAEASARAVEKLLDGDQIVIRRYVPRSMELRQTAEVLRDLRGRSFHMTEKGGLSAPPVDNISWMGDSLLLMDTEDRVLAMLALCEQLDGMQQEEEPVKTPRAEPRALEYQPRFVSLDAVRDALRSFTRTVDGLYPNQSFVEQRNVVILRDREPQLDEMLRLLARIDVPQEQVRITTWVAVVQPKGEPSQGLPAELINELEPLLPGFTFRADGFSVVRSTVGMGRNIELQIDGHSRNYGLALRPSAFDPETGRLTVDTCEFRKEVVESRSVSNGGVQQQMSFKTLFRTAVALDAGDYTVLGASGNDPIFLVVRIERLGQ